MKTKCNHLIGCVEYEGYENNSSEFHNLNELNLENAKALKSHDGFLFNFCPTCGKKLEGLLDKKIDELNNILFKNKEEERIRKEKVVFAFNEKVLEAGRNTKLDQLSDEGYFLVICDPVKSSYGQKVLFKGSKDLILRNIVHHNTNKSTPEPIIIQSIFQTLSIEEFGKIMNDCGWERKTETCFIKKEGLTETNLQYEIKECMIYINIKGKDSEGDSISNFARFSTLGLGKYLEIDIELTKINLDIYESIQKLFT